MSKICPDCGNKNDDGRIFCSACGNPLDAELRLIQDLQKNKHRAAEQVQKHRYDEDDEEVTHVSHQEEEKKSPLPLILLGVGAVVLVAAAVLLL